MMVTVENDGEIYLHVRNRISSSNSSLNPQKVEERYTYHNMIIQKERFVMTTPRLYNDRMLIFDSATTTFLCCKVCFFLLSNTKPLYLMHNLYLILTSLVFIYSMLYYWSYLCSSIFCLTLLYTGHLFDVHGKKEKNNKYV